MCVCDSIWLVEQMFSLERGGKGGITVCTIVGGEVGIPLLIYDSSQAGISGQICSNSYGAKKTRNGTIYEKKLIIIIILSCRGCKMVTVFQDDFPFHM